MTETRRAHGKPQEGVYLAFESLAGARNSQEPRKVQEKERKQAREHT